MSQDPPEVRLSGETVYSGRVIRLELERVRLRDGSEGRRELIRHPGATLIVPVDDDGQVYLIRQFRYAAGRELLELPAGTLDPRDPDPLACAQRELAEEAALAAARWEPLGGYYTTPGFTTEVIWAFLARDLSPRPGVAGDSDEYIEVFKVPLSEALEMAADGRIEDAKTIVGLFRAARVLAGESHARP